MPTEIIEGASTITWATLVLAAVVLIASFILARLVRRRVRSWLEARSGVSPHVPETVGRISGWSINLIGIVGALIVLGFQLGPVVLVLLLVAAAIGISGKTIMENWASGLSLQILAPFTIGDRIETEGITGWVEEINGREVVLTSRDRRTIRIPNATVANSVLYNYTDDQQRRTEMRFDISYNEDPSQAEVVTTTAVAALELVRKDPAPVAYVNHLGDFGYEFLMRFYHDDKDRKPVRTLVAKAIVNSLNEAGIERPTPELAIIKNPQTSTAGP